jgi:hypothetical protein
MKNPKMCLVFRAAAILPLFAIRGFENNYLVKKLL